MSDVMNESEMPTLRKMVAPCCEGLDSQLRLRIKFARSSRDAHEVEEVVCACELLQCLQEHAQQGPVKRHVGRPETVGPCRLLKLGIALYVRDDAAVVLFYEGVGIASLEASHESNSIVGLIVSALRREPSGAISRQKLQTTYSELMLQTRLTEGTPGKT